MDIKKDLKNGVKLAADAATDLAQALVEKSRLRANANRIKQVIKGDTELMNQAYIELGRYFYENLREDADKEQEALCVVVDKTKKRISKASRKYVELLSKSSDVNLSGENAEKLKVAVSDTAGKIKDSTKEKVNDIKTKAKDKASDISLKAKETVADISYKAKDKVDDFRVFIAPDENTDVLIDEDGELYEEKEVFDEVETDVACVTDVEAKVEDTKETEAVEEPIRELEDYNPPVSDETDEESPEEFTF
ncbi:MAG: hypothetical protein IKB73_02200 [Ruminococcus sp.]|nr:hypothetical protein [Ruminococcus sp.]